MSFGIPVRNGLSIGLLASTFLTSGSGRLVPRLTLNFLTGAPLDSRITFSRTTTGTFVGSNGLIQSAAIDAPRFDYNPATLAPLGLLIEEQRINLTRYSEQFDDILWVKTNTPVTTDATTSPDGTTNADKLIGTTTAAGHQCLQTSVLSATLGTTYTFSVYIKAAEYGFAFIGLNGTAFSNVPYISINLSTGAVTTANGTPVSSSAVSSGNGWLRVTITGTTNVVAGSVTPDIRPSPDGLWANRSTAQDGTSGIFIWGAQTEAGLFATSYIPTVATTVTRAADNATMTGANFSSWYNPSQGTIVAFYNTTTVAVSLALCAFSVSDTTTSERMQIRRNTGNINATFLVSDNGVVQYNQQVSTLSGPYRSALAYANGDFMGVNNKILASAGVGTVPTVTQAEIGFGPGTNYLNGHLSTITYYASRLTNAQLQAITA